VVEELRIPVLDLINQAEQGGVSSVDTLVIKSPQHHSTRHSRWAFNPRKRPAGLARGPSAHGLDPWASTIRGARLSEGLGQADRLLQRQARVFRVNHLGARRRRHRAQVVPLARHEGTSSRCGRSSLDKRSPVGGRGENEPGYDCNRGLRRQPQHSAVDRLPFARRFQRKRLCCGPYRA
jgi:hypothetical protein